MIPDIIELILFYSIFPTLLSIFLTWILFRFFRIPGKIVWVIVFVINMLAFYMVAVGTEGFGFFLPWWIIFTLSSNDMEYVNFLNKVSLLSVAILTFITTITVFVIRKIVNN